MNINNTYALSIILPVYNEECSIQKTISDIYGRIDNFTNTAQIIVINDGSQDATARILQKMCQSMYRLKVVTHERNRGYGAALCSGIKAAQGEWLLLMDADGQFQLDSLRDCWPNRQYYDCLLGYRQKRKDLSYRLVLGRLGNGISNYFLGLKINDINCGFKLFKKELVTNLLLVSTGGAINFEIFYRLARTKQLFKLFQFPVLHYPRLEGKSTGGNFKVILKIIIDGFRIILK